MSGPFICPSKGLAILMGKTGRAGLLSGPLVMSKTNHTLRRGNKRNMSVSSGQESIAPRDSAIPQVNTVMAPPNDPCLIIRGIRYAKCSKGVGDL